MIDPLQIMEAAMDRSKTKALPLLLFVGLAFSACTTAPDYRAPAYPNAYYDGYLYDPTYDSLGFGFAGFGRFDHERDFNHGHEDHDFAQHTGHSFARFGGRDLAAHDGHGFARFGGHAFAAHGSFGGHRG
jgi:hypothetical protein